MTLEDLATTSRSVVSLEEAARLLGISRGLAQREARAGRLGPVTVLKVGRVVKVPVLGLRRALGLEAVFPDRSHNAEG